ncbi:MAG: hypothetical protein IJ272_00390 [Clostridia bacterium]|nr:hypothetical protein [Clostridia bacterium]
MERKFEIPKMSTEEISKWYSTIKPIVYKNGTAYYLRRLSDKELKATAYTCLNKTSDYAEHVDFDQLSFLIDVRMLHLYGYYGYFQPSVGEVIRQIPKEYLEKTIAFEIIDGGIGMNGIYNAELNAGFHVSVVRLYQAKDEANEVATPIHTWPTKGTKCPLGMKEEDFKTLLEFVE